PRRSVVDGLEDAPGSEPDVERERAVLDGRDVVDPPADIGGADRTKPEVPEQRIVRLIDGGRRRRDARGLSESAEGGPGHQSRESDGEAGPEILSRHARHSSEAAPRTNENAPAASHRFVTASTHG